MLLKLIPATKTRLRSGTDLGIQPIFSFFLFFGALLYESVTLRGKGERMAEETKQNGGTSPGFMQNQTFLYGFVALVFSLALPALIISCVAFQKLPSQCAASTSTLEEVTEHENLKLSYIVLWETVFAFLCGSCSILPTRKDTTSFDTYNITPPSLIEPSALRIVYCTCK